jgi:ABC-type dipeptide/oligopeptide/nickel transport system ATPase component
MNFAKVFYISGEILPHSWCRWTVNRVRTQNNSTNIRLIGDTGSGKSWSALAIAEIMAKLLNKEITEKNIYFSISDVIRRIAKNPPRPGEIFFIDEQQVDSSATDYNTLRGKAYTTFFSTVRSKRYIIISTMPFADMIIKKVRRFFHVEIETLGVDSKKQVVRSKPRLLEYHKHKDFIYRKRLTAYYKDKITKVWRQKKITIWDIPKPSNSLINLYEQMKAEFQQQTYKELVKDLDKYERKSNPVPAEKVDMKKIVLESLTPYQTDLYNIYNENPTFNLREISELLETKGWNSNSAKVSNNMKYMRGKGMIMLVRRKRNRDV